MTTETDIKDLEWEACPIGLGQMLSIHGHRIVPFEQMDVFEGVDETHKWCIIKHGTDENPEFSLDVTCLEPPGMNAEAAAQQESTFLCDSPNLYDAMCRADEIRAVLARRPITPEGEASLNTSSDNLSF